MIWIKNCTIIDGDFKVHHLSPFDFLSEKFLRRFLLFSVFIANTTNDVQIEENKIFVARETDN